MKRRKAGAPATSDSRRNPAPMDDPLHPREEPGQRSIAYSRLTTARMVFWMAVVS